MTAPQNIVAVMFDFDDTLTDETTTKLLEAHEIDAEEFWSKRNQSLLDRGWDPALSYLHLILEEAKEGGRLDGLTNDKLGEFGKSLEFYPGIPELFADLNDIASEHEVCHPVVEFYVVSSGLEAIIKGSGIAGHVQGIWGCTFEEQDGRIALVKNAVSFTEKTKYLYAIHKGCLDIRTKPYSVNRRVHESERRIPFHNMIYIGDGLTDVPCFSLLDRFGGAAFGVFDPRKEKSPKKAWEQLVAPRRVKTMNSPRYRRDDDLGALLRVAVSKICQQMDVSQSSALGDQ